MEEKPILRIEGLGASYGPQAVLRDVTLSILRRAVTAIVGPSGCGKTTLIRCINRMHEITPGAKISGKIFLEDQNLYQMDPILVRRQIGMVFQKPNPFPTMDIYSNVLAGFLLNGIRLDREERNRIVEESLRKAALWEEVKDGLHRKGTFLSGGQQQRLCIARALALNPNILLLDEPCSALDPVSTSKIEDLILELKKIYTLVLVTHNMQQAARVSDYTAFLFKGELVEYGLTDHVFTSPQKHQTELYVTGRLE